MKTYTKSVLTAIETRYLPATNTKPSRIVASAGDAGRIVRPYDSNVNENDAHYKVAMELAAKLDWTRWQYIGGATDRGYAWVAVI